MKTTFSQENTKTYTAAYKQKNRNQGKDPIFFYNKLNKNLQDKIQEEFQLKFEEEYVYLLLEAYRRDCLLDMIKIITMLQFRDQKSFFNFLKQQNSKTHLQCLFGENYNLQILKNQSDPIYYLQLLNRYLSISDQQIPLNCRLCTNLFETIDRNYQALNNQLPQMIDYVVIMNNQNPKMHFFEKYKANKQDLKLRIRLCFLATYAYNLCVKKDQPDIPFFIFQQDYCDFKQLQDPFLQEILNSGNFFIVSNKNNTKKCAFSDMPMVVDFSNEEVNYPSLYLVNQFEELLGYMWQYAGQISYPKSLSQDIYISLQNRLNIVIGQLVDLNLVKGTVTENNKARTLIIEAKSQQKQKLEDSHVLQKEQQIIQIFDYEDSLMEQKKVDPFEVEYIDPEYKCKFIFGDGLSITNYLLPNEYDSVQIENYPENEVSFFEEFKLNYQLIMSIKKKENKSIYVKCLNYALAEEFYNYFITRHLVKDKQNRLISKPLITENLYTNKTMQMMTVQYDSISLQRDLAMFEQSKNEQAMNEQAMIEQAMIQQAVDRFAKGGYKIILDYQNKTKSSDQKICYLLFDKLEIANCVKDTLNEQVADGIRFKSMEVKEIKQGKITIDQKVYIYYEELLKKITPNEYKILRPNEQEYEEKEVTQQFLLKKTEKVKKQIIRLFDNPKDNTKVNILIQSETDKLIFKGLYEIQMIIKPKSIYQLKDTTQYHIFTNENARNKLKELSINNSIYIHHNNQLNRLEFYTYKTAKKSQSLVQKVIKEIEEYINKYKIKVSYNIQQQSSLKLVEYLRSKRLLCQFENKKITTEIVYTEFKEQNSYILENFLKPFHQNIEDCQICYDTQELFYLSNCKCKSVCKSCLKEHIKDGVISSLTSYQDIIKCPSCTKQPISIRDINKIFDKFSLQDLFRMRFKSGIDHLQNSKGMKIFKGCEFPDCKGIMRIPYEITKDTKNNWQCPMCQYYYCIRHILKQQYHLPLHSVHEDIVTCEAQIKDIGVDDLKSLGLVKECPNCKTRFSHEEGCNHLTCKQCQCHFCAICNWYEMKQKDIYYHLQKEHSGIRTQVVNINNMNQQVKEKLQKKLEKKENNIKEGKNLNDDSDEEQNVFKKFELEKTCFFKQSDLDENLLKVLYPAEADNQLSQLQVSKILFE